MSSLPIKKKSVKEFILLSLLDGEKDLGAFVDESEAKFGDGAKKGGSTVSHDLRKLEDLNLIVKRNGKCSLTSRGFIEAQVCKSSYASTAVLDCYQEFWLTHDITLLPPTLLVDIGALSGSTVLIATPTDLYCVHLQCIKVLHSAKDIRAISPIYHPDYIAAFRERLNSGVKIQLIATQIVIEKIEQEAHDLLSKYIATGDFQIFVNENLGLAMALTDSCYTFGLFNFDKRYDADANMFGTGQKGLEWASRLFALTLLDSVPYVYPKKP